MTHTIHVHSWSVYVYECVCMHVYNTYVHIQINTCIHMHSFKHIDDLRRSQRWY